MVSSCVSGVCSAVCRKPVLLDLRDLRDSQIISAICQSSSDSSTTVEGIALRGEGNGNREEGKL